MLNHAETPRNSCCSIMCTLSRGVREENEPREEEMESEKEEEDSEGEMELTAKRQEPVATSLGPPALTKAQEKELRKVKKLDHSWLSDILDS